MTLDSETKVSIVDRKVFPFLLFNYYEVNKLVKLGQSSIQQQYSNFFTSSLINESKRTGCFGISNQTSKDSIYTLDITLDKCETNSKSRSTAIFAILFNRILVSSGTESSSETEMNISTKLTKGGSLISEKSYAVKRTYPFFSSLYYSPSNYNFQAELTANTVESLSRSTKQCIENVVRSNHEKGDSIQLYAQNRKPDLVFDKERVNEFHDSTSKSSNKAFGCNFFVGPGFLNGNISNYFDDLFLFGASLDAQKGKLVFQIDAYLSFPSIKDTMTFLDTRAWTKKDYAESDMIGCNLGYSLIDAKRFRFAPIGGIGINFIDVNNTILPYYKFGFLLDLKPLFLFHRHKIHDDNQNYKKLRLSLGYYSLIGKPEYSNYFNGSIIYFTVGRYLSFRKPENLFSNHHR
jgi:hypothetical protein